jgi:hypothetical protein
MATENRLDKMVAEYTAKFPLAQNPSIWIEVVGYEPLMSFMKMAIDQGEPIEFNTLDETTLDGYNATIGGKPI